MHLTNNLELGDDSPVADRAAGAPVCEIEVTEGMCAAGLMAAAHGYYGDGRYALTDECLSKIYLAMHRARLLPSPLDRGKRGDGV